jgi:hypothetical protein
VRRAIRAVGARLIFLPPYSPDLNPIEQVFAKLKILLRKAAERTVETTWRRIGSLLNRFTPHECANYIQNAGCRSLNGKRSSAPRDRLAKCRSTPAGEATVGFRRSDLRLKKRTSRSAECGGGRLRLSGNEQLWNGSLWREADVGRNANGSKMQRPLMIIIGANEPVAGLSVRLCFSI